MPPSTASTVASMYRGASVHPASSLDTFLDRLQPRAARLGAGATGGSGRGAGGGDRRAHGGVMAQSAAAAGVERRGSGGRVAHRWLIVPPARASIELLPQWVHHTTHEVYT